MDNKENNSSKKIIIKIIITVLIIIGIFGIWVVKNSDFLSKENNEKGTLGQDTNNSDVSKKNSDNSSSSENRNADFELNITEEIDLEQLKSYGLPIIIDFGADSCIPCKEMAPVLEKLNEELRGKAIIKFVDVWKYPELAQNFPISVIPTQVLFNKDGKPYMPSDANAAGMLQYTSKETKEHVFTTHEGGIIEDALLKILSEMGMEE